jgi:penicillin-insensitive murein endopeptidase
MAQPSRGGVHDDHLHVRTACSPEEAVAGCELTGPRRPWLESESPSLDEPSGELAAALFEPASATEAPASGGPSVP